MYNSVDIKPKKSLKEELEKSKVVNDYTDQLLQPELNMNKKGL